MRDFPEREWGAFWQLGDVGMRPRLWCEGTCPERPLAQLAAHWQQLRWQVSSPAPLTKRSCP